MLKVNGHTYNIDANACLEAYFLENEGWHDIMASPRFTHEERRTFFGPDCNRRNMREVRMSPEWVAIVSDFAKEHGLDVEDSIHKAILKPRGPQKKTKKGKFFVPARSEIRNEEVHKICTDNAERDSTIAALQRHINGLAGMVVEGNKRIDALEAELAELKARPITGTYRLVREPDSE